MRSRLEKAGDSLCGFQLAVMPLPVAKTQGMKLKTFLYRNRSRGGGVDSAAEKNDGVFANHVRGLRNFSSFHGVALFVPAHDTFVENFHVAVTAFVENAISQTGQVMGARSIENDRSVAWNALEIILELAQRRGDGTQNMNFAKLFFAAHVDDQRLGAGF